MSGGAIPGLRMFLSKSRHAGLFPGHSCSVLPQLLQRRVPTGGRSRRPGGHPHPHPHRLHPHPGLSSGGEVVCGLQHRGTALVNQSGGSFLTKLFTQTLKLLKCSSYFIPQSSKNIFKKSNKKTITFLYE